MSAPPSARPAAAREASSAPPERAAPAQTAVPAPVETDQQHKDVNTYQAMKSATLKLFVSKLYALRFISIRGASRLRTLIQVKRHQTDEAEVKFFSKSD